ncbi:MAG: S1-like domain-containing RNA-binding protein [bacterium]|nr:GntR family transcriptional regulator [Gammaproteobacteria bacterium]HIL95654.1 GntR family transcriptional regulator [Pseudomonadales bacterium]
MIEVGHRYILNVAKVLEQGIYLDAENLGEVLLPRRQVPYELAVGDHVDVFLYLDSENRYIATTRQPKAEVSEFAYLNVVASTSVGAFLNWGLEKDLLVPFAEQHRPMEVGHSYLVYLYAGKVDGRITASSKIDKFLTDDRPHDFKPRQPVDLIVANTTDLGYKAIVNHSHWGVLYKNEVHQRLSFGQSIKGYIKFIRSDGKIDLSIDGGQEARDKYAKTILGYLKDADGFAPVHDKSDPALILKLFGMSKKSFKKTIGALYKQRVITIDKDGIRLTERTDL